MKCESKKPQWKEKDTKKLEERKKGKNGKKRKTTNQKRQEESKWDLKKWKEKKRAEGTEKIKGKEQWTKGISQDKENFKSVHSPTVRITDSSKFASPS